ncbi:FAD-dependent oxidoreductase [Intestinimonas massiliensis (ex Afouda et al. 2020)]|uniref:FAD-dependent oxidoreductase n=1 Tax=Intestinimonas massiliensis (ex Afouda et al. 2020) TaxID=1673721 RepID=UPI001030D6D0|nr:FAD-dependent oxidoreductase [Intestinimonas massiliensis (ex Afouda et al. 2020)]
MKTLLSDKEHYPHLFSPAVIRGKYFKNRIIASPHGCRLPVLEIDGTGYAHITELGIKYYAGPAKGGAAVVNMMEGGVEPGGGGIVTPSYNLFKPNTLATMHLFTDYVHAYGALASMELTHIGQWSKNAVGPTEKILYTGAKVHELTEKDIDEIVRYYSNAANMVRRGGFDVIMLHGGHNWLLSQFMSPYENKRIDRFGGSPENRIRLASMVLDAIRDRIGGDLVIEFRISLSEFTNGGVTPEDAVEMLKFIEDKVDIIQCSGGTRHVQPTMGIQESIYYMPNCEKRHLAAYAKRHLHTPISAIGSINDPDVAEEILANGEADFIATARNFMADNEWGIKARMGRKEDIRPCIRCMRCLDISASRINTARPGNVSDFENGTFHWECSVNPKELLPSVIHDIPKPVRQKKVLVVGGGPAGMEAALDAADRGHKVILFEETGSLGGQLIHSDYMGFKVDLKKFKDFLIRQVNKNPNIEIRLNTPATPELCESEKADAVIVAIGSKPIVPNIPGKEKNNTFLALDLYGGKPKVGEKIVIIGGGSVGCETALYLAEQGKTDVTVIEMGDILLPETLYIDRYYTLWFMEKEYDREKAVFVNETKEREHPIKSMVKTKCTAITEEGVMAVDENGAEKLIPADTVIFAVGMRSDCDARDAFYGTAFDVINAGDCNGKEQSIYNATSSGFFAALQL